MLIAAVAMSQGMGLYRSRGHGPRCSQVEADDLLEAKRLCASYKDAPAMTGAMERLARRGF